MGKIIITGAGGFVGTALTKKFIENGKEVIAISKAFHESFPNNPLITKIESEISTAEELKEIIPKEEYDAFYHLAWRGVNGPEKADSLIQVGNIRLALNCAKAAKAIECKKYLCAGTVAECAVKSLPNLEKTSNGMAYGVAKYCARQMLEYYCKNIGMKLVWMQFANIYGPTNKTGNLISYTLDQLSAEKAATFGPSLQPYDFIYVDDVIEAAYRLGIKKTKHSFYFVGSGEPKLLKDYLVQIGQIFGRPDLIKVGERPDDGIVYAKEMFSTKDLVEDIGEYVTAPFEQSIRYTIEHY